MKALEYDASAFAFQLTKWLIMNELAYPRGSTEGLLQY